MIDPITEQILLEAKVIESLKKIIPQLKNVILKKDFKGMSRIAKQLPQKKNFSQIKQGASKLPNFRQKYNEAIRAVEKSKVLDPSVYEPAAVAIAIVSLSSNNKVSEIIKTGDRGVLQAGLITSLIPGGVFIVPILKLSFFIIIITSILIVGGDVVIPAFMAFAKGIGYLLSILGNGFMAMGRLAAEGLGIADTTTTDVVNGLLGTTIEPDTFEQIGQAMQIRPPGTAGLFFKRKK
jgi:hypothetical protein